MSHLNSSPQVKKDSKLYGRGLYSVVVKGSNLTSNHSITNPVPMGSITNTSVQRLTANTNDSYQYMQSDVIKKYEEMLAKVYLQNREYYENAMTVREQCKMLINENEKLQEDLRISKELIKQNRDDENFRGSLGFERATLLRDCAELTREKELGYRVCQKMAVELINLGYDVSGLIPPAMKLEINASSPHLKPKLQISYHQMNERETLKSELNLIKPENQEVFFNNSQGTMPLVHAEAEMIDSVDGNREGEVDCKINSVVWPERRSLLDIVNNNDCLGVGGKGYDINHITIKMLESIQHDETYNHLIENLNLVCEGNPNVYRVSQQIIQHFVKLKSDYLATLQECKERGDLIEQNQMEMIELMNSNNKTETFRKRIIQEHKEKENLKLNIRSMEEYLKFLREELDNVVCREQLAHDELQNLKNKNEGRQTSVIEKKSLYLESIRNTVGQGKITDNDYLNIDSDDTRRVQSVVPQFNRFAQSEIGNKTSPFRERYSVDEQKLMSFNEENYNENQNSDSANFNDYLALRQSVNEYKKNNEDYVAEIEALRNLIVEMDTDMEADKKMQEEKANKYLEGVKNGYDETINQLKKELDKKIIQNSLLNKT